LLGWERQENESARAYEGFCAYRDMGPSRSLAKVGRLLGKSRALIERWSAEHEWVDRVKALEARDAMVARDAVQKYLQDKAQDLASRQAALLEGALELGEKALEQARAMLEWPLVEQRTLREGPDGEDQTIILMPARWSKANVKTMFDIVTSVGTGRWTSGTEDPDGELEFDLSPLDLDEQRQLQAFLDRIGVKPPEVA